MLLLFIQGTQQNSYSISHLLGTVTVYWLLKTAAAQWPTANDSVVTVLLAAVIYNSHYTVTVQSQCSDCA